LYCWAEGDLGWESLGTLPAHTQADIWGSSRDDIYVVTGGDDIMHWDGETLLRADHNLPMPIDTTFRAVYGAGPDDVWVASPMHTLHFDGEVWSEEADGTERSREDATPVEIVATAANDVWVMRSFNLYSHFDGTQWRPEGYDDHERRLGCASDGELVAVTTEPLEILAGPPGLMRPVSTEIEAYGVSSAWLGGPSDIWVLGTNGTAGPQILRFTDDWSTSIESSGYALIALWGFAGGHVVAVGYDVILRRAGD
jgi:hypothetical protein